MALKPKRSDAGNLDLPKRNHQDLPLSEKVKVLDLTRKEKKSLKLLTSRIRMNLLSVEFEEGKRNSC